MGSTRTRLIVATLTTLVASGAALAWWKARARTVDSVRLFDNADSVQELLQKRANDSARRDPTAFLREPIGPEVAAQLWAIEPQWFEYDPHSYYKQKGGIDFFQAWPEHDGGGFQRRTSRDGWREDFDELPRERDLFVVTTGDSHTDGLCANAESFANVLEAALHGAHPAKHIEALNTGVSGYSFYNYLGVLEKLLPEKPDAFVVAFYGGNDFLDMVKPWHWFHHTAPPPRSPEYWKRMSEAQKVSSSSVAIAMNQLLYFQYYPDQVDVALRAAEGATREIERLCREHGIALWYVYIPPGFATEGELKPMVTLAKEKLGLTDGDLQTYNRLADRLLERIRPLNIPVIDLRPLIAGHVNEYYWSDLHINVRGQKLIAEQLLPLVESRFSAKLH